MNCPVCRISYPVMIRTGGTRHFRCGRHGTFIVTSAGLVSVASF